MSQHPNPAQIFAAFEAKRITRGQLHAALDWHHRQLIDEVSASRDDPRATWLEGLLSKRQALRWGRRHGERRLRLMFHALAELPDFPPARFLWNALHPDVPLHCFFRMRTEPVFRLVALEMRGGPVDLTVEYGTRSEGLIRERLLLQPARVGYSASRPDSSSS